MKIKADMALLINSILVLLLSLTPSSSLKLHPSTNRRTITKSTNQATSGFGFGFSRSPPGPSRSFFDPLILFRANTNTLQQHLSSSCLSSSVDVDVEDGKDPNNNNNNNNNNNKITLYPKRWVMLGYLSTLAFLSDWICFSTAATPGPFESVYSHSPAELIDLFLFTNVASCFFVTDLIAKIGLHKSIKGAAVLMAGGCFMKSGIPFLGIGSVISDTTYVPYSFLVAGTLMVGAAQPFFQCTPPLLSAKWFGKSERATATAVALNANQIGIATAFLVGGHMAIDTTGIEEYYQMITVITTVVAIATVMQFEEKVSGAEWSGVECN